MAIIKCPECGHQISDKAPICPSCGVEISGKVIKCTNCGEIYFNDEECCPNCHQPSVRYRTTENMTNPQETLRSAVPPIIPQNVQTKSETVRQNSPSSHGGNTSDISTPPVPPTNSQFEQKKNNNNKYIWISIVIALIVCATCFYFYSNAKDNQEQEDYEYAMQSTDPAVLQSYLDKYKDADQAHIDSIQSHLEILKHKDDDWNNAVISGSRSALEDYIRNNPDSPHKQEALNKIDSLDWISASNENTIDAYQQYLSNHVDGIHIDEANEAMKKIKSKEVQSDEKQMISGLFRKFFQSVNSRNELGLTATVEEVMTSFLGKHMATKSDVASFIDKIYKDDITNMNFKINNDYKIKKKEVGEDEFEYQVEFTAEQSIERTNPELPTNNHFRINAKVSPDGKISEMNMVKIIK
ncbi:zinc-ribbon domain-containing protein [Segatella bryantii]|uniref:zinc-ribbon domain-containing protein n=1 Tax=Segatella bryantii TaxID=77095 RepID=UPI00243050A8|nr:zinc-ribbon domain-containing protein [Segatella bryantii]MBQ3858335.1 zinc-ribbon domain-containing protein [Prevotella sp.]